MHQYFLTTNSVYAIKASIFSIALILSSVVNADELKAQYNPTIELSTRNSKKRNITELDYMQPIWNNGDGLAITDLKLKLDNEKSKEVNLGLVYRHNFDSKIIVGVYNYFDHRRTGNNFGVSGITPGIEVLSKYIDARVNVYIPQNKKKKNCA